MAAKRTTPRSPQSVPDTSADFDGVLRRMLEMPPDPKVAKKIGAKPDNVRKKPLRKSP
jgi:hypothetical protein